MSLLFTAILTETFYPEIRAPRSFPVWIGNRNKVRLARHRQTLILVIGDQTFTELSSGADSAQCQMLCFLFPPSFSQRLHSSGKPRNRGMRLLRVTSATPHCNSTAS